MSQHHIYPVNWLEFKKKFSTSSNAAIAYGIFAIGITLIAIGVSVLSLDFVSPIDAKFIAIGGFIIIYIGLGYFIYEERSQK